MGVGELGFWRKGTRSLVVVSYQTAANAKCVYTQVRKHSFSDRKVYTLFTALGLSETPRSSRPAGVLGVSSFPVVTGGVNLQRKHKTPETQEITER